MKEIKMRTITRNDMADVIFSEVGLSRKDSSEILDMMIEEIKSALADGEDVKLSSFGTFSLRRKNARIGRNPKTGVEATISPRTVISFKASQLLRKKLNA